MATQKSSNERIRRKLRPKNLAPKKINLTGRIEVKKTGDNDPQKKYRRKIAEKFLKWYKGEIIEEKHTFINTIDNLISLCIESSGIPLSIKRLQDMKLEVTNG